MFTIVVLVTQAGRIVSAAAAVDATMESTHRGSRGGHGDTISVQLLGSLPSALLIHRIVVPYLSHPSVCALAASSSTLAKLASNEAVWASIFLRDFADVPELPSSPLYMAASLRECG